MFPHRPGPGLLMMPVMYAENAFGAAIRQKSAFKAHAILSLCQPWKSMPTLEQEAPALYRTPRTANHTTHNSKDA